MKLIQKHSSFTTKQIQNTVGEVKTIRRLEWFDTIIIGGVTAKGGRLDKLKTVVLFAKHVHTLYLCSLAIQMIQEVG